MVYAASVCGSVLYSLRHNFDGPIPDALKESATPLGVFWVSAGGCMFVAVIAYIIRRLGQLNNFPVNIGVIDTVSVILFIFSIIIAYVVFSLKHSLASGMTPATTEQTASFREQWEARRDA
ncbi:hypothetical protein [Sphingomonas metalli]|nr:hypothetical protein [Sphingomonas metalli]